MREISLALFLSLHALVLATDSLLNAAGFHPTFPCRYLSLVGSHQRWDIFKQVPAERGERMAFLVSGEESPQSVFLGGDGPGEEDPLRLERYFFRRSHHDQGLRRYVARWCRERGLSPADTIILRRQWDRLAEKRSPGGAREQFLRLSCLGHVPRASTSPVLSTNGASFRDDFPGSRP